MHGWLAMRSLAWRELVRFFRQRHRVIASVGQPVIFWLLFGAGWGPSFNLADSAGNAISYREYFFPGALGLVLLFTAIFATMSLIEDRREAFLQGVLVSPAPRWSIVGGKLAGSTLVALLHAAVYLILSLTLSVKYSAWSLGLLVVFSFILSLGLTALGYVLAWKLDSTQGYHAMMSMLLFPMWMLSGAFFPPGTVSDKASSTWISHVIQWNPLTYGIAELRRLLYWYQPDRLPSGLPSEAVCWGVTCSFTVCMCLLAWYVTKNTSGPAE